MPNQAKSLLNKFSKNDLPIFFSSTIFFQIVATLKMKKGQDFRPDLTENLIRHWEHFLDSDKSILQIKVFQTKWGGINQ
jgi:hypothetical protein